MIEIITGRERRRRWSVVEKLRIVAESQEPGVRVCDVAARHDVSPSLLHGWRHLARRGGLRSVDAIDFVPVRLASSTSDASVPPPPPPSTHDRHQHGLRYRQSAGVSQPHLANRAGLGARLTSGFRGSRGAGSGGRVPPLRPGFP